MTNVGITDTPLTNPESVGESIQTPFRRFLEDFCENKIAVVSFVVVVAVVMIALFAPFIAPTDPYDLAIVTVADKALSPGMTMLSGQVAYLGTDGSVGYLFNKIGNFSFTSLISPLSNCSNSWSSVCAFPLFNKPKTKSKRQIIGQKF